MDASSLERAATARLQQQLGDAVRVIHLPQVGSTNTRLKELVGSGLVAAPTLLITDHQTAGRGTRSRIWFQASLESHDGQFKPRDVALTLGLPWDGEPDPRLSLTIGATVADAVARACNVPVHVKWPNDLLAGDPPLKVGGILLEASQGWLLIGVGINVNSTPLDFPADIAHRLTTLAQVARRHFDVDLLRLAIARALTQLPRVDLAAGLERFRALDQTAGTRYALMVDGKPLEVTARGMDAEGALLLEDAQGNPHRVISFSELESAG
jgi:BirA family transcriptional regulator, biotin operon repressor / biotin---[acetyl-CoA-carboxylase] ligase